MLTIHDEYPQEESHAARTPEEARVPGAFLGSEIRFFHSMREGDVVTLVRDHPTYPWWSSYYFDPELLVDGVHFAKVESEELVGGECEEIIVGGGRWIRVGSSVAD